MAITINRDVTRWIIIVASFIIISLILWNTYSFFQNFKAEERSKMKNFSLAMSELIMVNDLGENVSDFPLKIIQSNTSTPMIIVDRDNNVSLKNIDTLKAKDSVYVNTLIEQFKKENNPIPITYEGQVLSKLYYGDSPVLNKLKYYPLGLLLIILLFGAVVYFFYRSTKIADQNKLWTGMAKETAHQIGTPLSSLVGWTEILKNENVNPEYLIEIQKDISRLQTITDRFSKIGSLPTLHRCDVVTETLSSFDYLKSRSSKLINFEISTPEKELFVNLNTQLYSWTIENLVKNAIDAMQGRGSLKLNISNDDKLVYITVEDTGKGISKQNYSAVFKPGFTTKKRGWGLGLSLAKRIIEDYHNGKIKVLHSEIGEGTTMQITLKLIE